MISDNVNWCQGLRAFESELEARRAAAAPKSKFAFKRKAKAPTSAPLPSAPTTAALESAPIPAAAASTTHITLSSHTRRYLTMASLPLPPDPSQLASARDLTISDLDECIVDLLPRETAPDGKTIQLGALHIRNITNSVLLLPCISGSALLHDMDHCVVVVGCHQFRMHASTAIDVHLGVPSLPVIEHCAGIRFGPYPLSSVIPSSARAMQDRGLDGKYREVQDFSHVRATPSPNWSLLPQGDGKGWEELLGGGEREVGEGELRAALPPKLV
ncbi:hypothetical protein HWV62_11866 [Athelia sp. TMB]|nr:hypothetical protein HWV62_11866 [Athelia sp. TMB]